MAMTERLGSWVGQQADGGTPDNPSPRMANVVRTQINEAMRGDQPPTSESDGAPETSHTICVAQRRVSAATAAAEARFTEFLLSEPRYTTQED